MLYTKITSTNISELFELLQENKLVSQEQFDERIFHIGKYAYIDNIQLKVIISSNKPNGEQVLLKPLAQQIRRMRNKLFLTNIEYNIHNLLSSDYRYHLYQCKDGLNIWTKQRIELGEHVQIGKVLYKLYPSPERINNPQQSINSDELYYEFTIKEVRK